MELGNNDGSARSTSKPPVYYIVSASNYDRLKQKETQSREREVRLVRKQLSRLLHVCEDLVQREPERAGGGMNKMLKTHDCHQRRSSANLQQRRRTSSARSAFELRRDIACSFCSLSNENISVGNRTRRQDLLSQLRRCKSLDFEASFEQSDYHPTRQRNEVNALQYKDKDRLGYTSNISRTSMINRNRRGAYVDQRIANSGFIKREVEQGDSDSCVDEDETSLTESILDWHEALKRVFKSTNILQIKLTNLGEGPSESARRLERLRTEIWQKMKMAEEVISLLENCIDGDNAKDKYLHLQEN